MTQRVVVYTPEEHKNRKISNLKINIKLFLGFFGILMLIIGISFIAFEKWNSDNLIMAIIGLSCISLLIYLWNW